MNIPLRRFGVVCVTLVLPMVTCGARVIAQESSTKGTAYPVIVATSPEIGATDVDPTLKEITVTFDRDMQKGMSWTGGGPAFPADENRKAEWRDARTCALPVTLAKGKAYRVGINSKSYQNFRSQDGQPTPPAAIYFVTKGANAAVKQRIAVPKVVTLTPANNATDVDPATKELKVTFDVPMGEGMSWTGGGDEFPTTQEGKKATWSKDRRTCTLPVSLKPGHTYRLGLNSQSHNNFQNELGISLEPVIYTFSTKK